MDSPGTPVEMLLDVSRRLRTSTGEELAEYLATRRQLIEQLSRSGVADSDVARLRDAAELGRQTRVRMLVGTAQIRQEIRDLEAVRRGLGRFKPASETSQQIDVRI
jgi:hypothetical protein